MDLFDIIKQHSEIITAVTGAFGAIVIFWKHLKNFVVKKYQEHKLYISSRNQIPSTLQEIKTGISDLDHRLKNVEYEISPNGGGSMKDSLKIIKAEIEAMFWLNPKPSFRTTSKGINIQVNEAYCHLCGTPSEELLRQNWKNFVEDEDQLDDYMRRWEYSTNAASQFAGKLKFKNSRDESVGEWMVKIRPLGPLDGGEDYLWHGTLYPFDQKAKDYARSYNIPLN